MIAYLDASALVKRYVVERGSRETQAFMADADIVATSIVSRAEVSAAFATAARTRLVTIEAAPPRLSQSRPVDSSSCRYVRTKFSLQRWCSHRGRRTSPKQGPNV